MNETQHTIIPSTNSDFAKKDYPTSTNSKKKKPGSHNSSTHLAFTTTTTTKKKKPKSLKHLAMGHSYSYCPVVGGMHSDNCPPGYGKCCPWTAFVPPAKPAYTAGVPGQYIPDDTSTSDDDDDRDVDRMNNAMVGMGYGNFGKGKGGALEVRDLEALGFVVRGEGEREGDGLVRREAQAQVQVLTVPVAGTILEIPQSTSTSSDIAALDFEGWLIVCFAVLGGIGMLSSLSSFLFNPPS